LMLVPRRLLTGWTMRGERGDVLAYLRHRGYAVERLEIRPLRSSAVAHGPKWSGWRSPTRTDAPAVAATKSSETLRATPARRPNVASSQLRERFIDR